MRFLVIRDDAPLDTIRSAITELRGRQKLSVIASTYVEIGDDINELLEMRVLRVAAGLELASPGGAVVPMDPGPPAAGRDHGAGRDSAGSSGNPH